MKDLLLYGVIAIVVIISLGYQEKIDPQNAYGWYNKYLALLNRPGKYDEAIKAYKRALQINPNVAPNDHGQDPYDDWRSREVLAQTESQMYHPPY